jgi:hypothetical protein
MQTVEKISDEIGRKRLAALIGVGRSAVTNAIKDGVFPASWFVVVSRECEAAKIDCPLSAFNFKEAAE